MSTSISMTNNQFELIFDQNSFVVFCYFSKPKVFLYYSDEYENDLQQNVKHVLEHLSSLDKALQQKLRLVLLNLDVDEFHEAMDLCSKPIEIVHAKHFDLFDDDLKMKKN